jgi:hypothetical protein
VVVNDFKEIFGGVVCFLFGVGFIWGIKGIQKETFLHTDKYNTLKKMTPFPLIFNYWLIKTIYGLGAVIAIGGGIFTFARLIMFGY